MRDSPRRPLILKRRKLSLPKEEDNIPRDVPDGRQKETATSSSQQIPDGIRILDHPSMPNTQVVVIPKTADLQSVIEALTAKGKGCGPQGPNKFILLSSGGGVDEGPASPKHSNVFLPDRDGSGICVDPLPLSGHFEANVVRAEFTSIFAGSSKSLTEIKPLNKELDCSPLDESLTNIQWLGRMSTDSLKPGPVKIASNKENKENNDLGAQVIQVKMEGDEGLSSVNDTLSERPPYSYMAMIQFAINSKKSKMMTLKEIYTWIEDHFPYFRRIAKPGWKNSIRHNLSLHDMFIRETSPDGKISYWTIRPEANRCLTLDQVYKPVMDPAIPSQVHTVQHQKRGLPETNKSALPCGSERKMKPLLPRTDSYLVPFQLPLNPPIILPAATQLPLSAAQHNSSSTSSSALRCGKRVRIAPKIPQTSEASALIQPQREPWKDKQLYVCGSQTPEAPVDILPRERKETSSSRRKQRLVLPSAEEPVLLFPESSFIDSGLASDLSAFQDTREVELESPVKEYAFKTPIKGGLPASSTPSKAISGEPPVVPGLWRTTPLSKRSHGVLDFSPIRTPRGVSLTPQREDQTPFSFSSTPFKELPLFDSPRELLNTYSPSSLSRLGASSPIPESDGLKQCSHELQGGLAGANRSLTEGLVLDTMNDSLSKILVDISFTGLEDEDLGMGNISWSQLIPELK
ncbi:forkhead box protein M1 isoform X2 [Amia ocellicauda]|uniref:forkhead box protein M1 isoform X2 n=1 Tax=Amia ocellicauda TaxID=2972642 RepID=UPI003464A117